MRLYGLGTIGIQEIAKHLKIGKSTVSRWSRWHPDYWKRSARFGMKWRSNKIQRQTFESSEEQLKRFERKYSKAWMGYFSSKPKHDKCTGCGVTIKPRSSSGHGASGSSVFCTRLCKRKHYRNTLSDRYIKDHIARNTGLSSKDFPPEIIALQREKIKLKRAIRKHRNETKHHQTNTSKSKSSSNEEPFTP